MKPGAEVVDALSKLSRVLPVRGKREMKDLRLMMTHPPPATPEPPAIKEFVKPEVPRVWEGIVRDAPESGSEVTLPPSSSVSARVPSGTWSELTLLPPSPTVAKREASTDL